MLNVSDFFAAAFPEGTMEDEKLAMAQNDATPLKGRVAFRLTVESPRHLQNLALSSRRGGITYCNSTAAGNATHIKQFRRSH